MFQFKMFLFTFIWKFVFELVHADRQVSGLMDRKHRVILHIMVIKKTRKMFEFLYWKVIDD